MSTPTLKELISQATPGKRDTWGATLVFSEQGTICVCGEPRATNMVQYTPASCTGDRTALHEAAANAQLIARLSPEVAGAVYEALEMASLLCDTIEQCAGPQGGMPELPRVWRQILSAQVFGKYKQMRRAIALLDGKEDAK